MHGTEGVAVSVPRAEYLRKLEKTQMTITVATRLAEEIDRIAEYEGVPRQSVLFWAIRDYLSKRADLETQDRAS